MSGYARPWPFDRGLCLRHQRAPSPLARHLSTRRIRLFDDALAIFSSGHAPTFSYLKMLTVSSGSLLTSDHAHCSRFPLVWSQVFFNALERVRGDCFISTSHHSVIRTWLWRGGKLGWYWSCVAAWQLRWFRGTTHQWRGCTAPRRFC